MFMVLSSWQSHCKSSPGSFDECRMAPSGRRPKTKECFRTVECQQVESSRWMEQQQKKCQLGVYARNDEHRGI